MKKSIRWRFTLAFVITLLAVFAAILIINSNFLERYYFQHKQKTLVSAYKELERLASQEWESNSDRKETYREEMTKLFESNNISSVVIGKDFQYTYVNDPDNMVAKLQEYRMMSFLGETFSTDIQLLMHTEHFQILMTRNSQTQNSYMECWGVLGDSGQYFVMSSPMESIRESVDISNRFYIEVGMLCMLLGTLYIFFATKKMVKPLERLTGISRKMADLDFFGKV